MPDTTLMGWFDSLNSEGLLRPKNPDRFKKATASIICTIINFNKVEDEAELCKFCDLFKKEFHIDEEMAKRLFEESSEVKQNLAKNAKIIKDELDNDEYKLLEYMKMLNRFIIVDHCDDEDYCIFDELKILLFD